MSNASNVGITSNDFINNPLTDFGVTVSWEQATKTTDNITGDETITYAPAVDKTVVFLRRSVIYELAKEGLVERGDAYIMAKTSDNFQKEDRITYDGVTYKIASVIRRKADGEDIFDFCTLFKI
jgi:hypothetical protein